MAMISRLFDFLPSGSGIPVALRIAIAGSSSSDSQPQACRLRRMRSSSWGAVEPFESRGNS